MPFLLSLACLQMGLSPAEALTAATINAAWSLGLATDSARSSRQTSRFPDARIHRLPRTGLLYRRAGESRVFIAGSEVTR